MVVEIGIISFVPLMKPSVIFYVFLVNRILSGLAEASASGADEALAYDTLKQENSEGNWGDVLEILTRFQSIGFIVAMTIGAAVYDPELVQSVLKGLGITCKVTQESTLRFPLYLTFVMAVFALVSAIRMKEVPADPANLQDQQDKPDKSLKTSLRLTLSAGKWILKTPFVFWVIGFGMLFDGIIRMVITLSSQYYRLIDLPESSFGLIGSGVAVLGFFIPGIAHRIVKNNPPVTGLWTCAILTLAGLWGMCFFWPWLGLLPALITFSAMYFTGFFVSYYLNQTTSSDQRATVLSFKGLCYNISYGILGILYALLVKMKKSGYITETPKSVADIVENRVFIEAFPWFLASFVLVFILLLIFSRLKGINQSLGSS